MTNNLDLTQSEDAFSVLYETLAPRVYRYLLSRTPTADIAEELVSTIFLRAFTALSTFNGSGQTAFQGWVMTIAHNQLANWYRDTGRKPILGSLEDQESLAITTPSAETLAEKHEQLNELRAAVSSLSGSQQSLITMKYTQGLTNAQIGNRLNKTEGAIKQLNRRTLKALEAILDSDIQ